jgi:hypothetical protein
VDVIRQLACRLLLTVSSQWGCCWLREGNAMSALMPLPCVLHSAVAYGCRVVTACPVAASCGK